MSGGSYRGKVKRVQPSLFDAPPESTIDQTDPPKPAYPFLPESFAARELERRGTLFRPPVSNQPDPPAEPPPTTPILCSDEKAKAHDLIAAIRTLGRIEQEHRPATDAERDILARFPGFGSVALSIFPNPTTGLFKDDTWERLGLELQSLLTPKEYASAKRTVFNAFYTSPTVITAMYSALKRLGVPQDALLLEPGAGSGNFISHAPKGMQVFGIELDGLSGRIAQKRNPHHQVRIEDFTDSVLPKFNAVIGNVPFANVNYDYKGQRLALHDVFIAKSVDQLAPGGILTLVTSHFTMDKQNASIREYLASKADFLGAIRLPSDAFKREGTAVVTDIVFMRKRSLDDPPKDHERC